MEGTGIEPVYANFQVATLTTMLTPRFKFL